MGAAGRADRGDAVEEVEAGRAGEGDTAEEREAGRAGGGDAVEGREPRHSMMATRTAGPITRIRTRRERRGWNLIVLQVDCAWRDAVRSRHP